MSFIHSWVASGSASITVLSHRLHLDKDCNTFLNNLNEPDCPLQSDTKSDKGDNAGEFSSFLIGAIIFCVLILVLILVIMVIIIKTLNSKRRER